MLRVHSLLGVAPHRVAMGAVPAGRHSGERERQCRGSPLTPHRMVWWDDTSCPVFQSCHCLVPRIRFTQPGHSAGEDRGVRGQH